MIEISDAGPVDPQSGLRRPHIVTVGRYRVGQMMQSVARQWRGAQQALVSHVSASFDEAVHELQALAALQPVDALVMAGASGAAVRGQVDIPVAMVEVRGLGLLDALAQARRLTTPEKPQIGLVSLGASSVALQQFDDLFGLGVAQFVYHGEDDAAACVQQLLSANIGAVVAPGLVADLAEQAGIPGVLLYSEAAIRQALDEALLLARNRMAERDRHQWLEAALEELQDGVAAIDAQGRIRALNQPMARLLGGSVASLHGQALAQVSPILAQGPGSVGGSTAEGVVQLHNRSLALRRTPLLEGGVVTGSLLVCSDPVVIQRVERSLRASQRQRTARVRWSIDDFLGASPQVQQTRRLAKVFAQTDSTVLILGDSGTGKELIAQGIHNASRRAGQPFLAVNCAALAEGLLEAELFGYEDGAFTGARRGGKIGLIEAAHTGSLFLDEIGDMPLALQSRLLRVLQERELLRVGSTTAVPVDVRVIAATHANLDAMVEKRQFRRDLYYRLAVLRLRTPSLAERGALDIATLAHDLLARQLHAMGVEREREAALRASLDDLLTRAAHHAWPGNVRELHNWVERLITCRDCLGDEQGDLLLEIFPECAVRTNPLGSDEPAAGHSMLLKQTRLEVERQRVLQVLESVQGDQKRACELLGISRATLWRRLKQAGPGGTRPADGFTT